MKRFISFLTILLLVCFTSNVYATKYFVKSAINTGLAGSLDEIDGADVSDGDRAIVITTLGVYFYKCDASSAKTEAIPTVVAFETNGGDKRWHLISRDEIDAGAFGDIASTVAAISTTECTMVVSSDFTLTANLTIPSTLTLKIVHGGSISGAYTLTVNGPFEAGQYQVFGSDLTVTGSMNVDRILPQWWGSKGDNSTDDTDAIQAALACIHAMSTPPLAYTLYFPAGKYIISDTLIVNTHGITIEGEGGNYYFGSADQRYGSILKWDDEADADIAVLLRPHSGALFQPLMAPIIRRMNIDGQGVATIGLKVEATLQGVVKDISVRHCTTAAIQTNGTDLTSYTGLNQVHSCVFENLWIDQVDVADGYGLHLSGSDSDGLDVGQIENTTCARFVGVYVHHCNSAGIKLEHADSNYFSNIFISRKTGGTGIGMLFCACSTSDVHSVNSNSFYEVVAGEGGITVRGTPTDTRPSIGGIIFGLGIDTDNPLPVIEAGASLNYFINMDIEDQDNTLGQGFVNIVGEEPKGIRVAGTNTYGIDFVDGTFSGSQIRLQNETMVSARNGADDDNVGVFAITSGDQLAWSMSNRYLDGVDINFMTTTGSNIANSANQKFAFWGTTPVVQPSANADTSGANLATLEAEVNQLKQLLRDVGLMAP